MTRPLRPTRRSFLTASAAGLAAPFALPRWSVRSPNETLNIACIGVGGMGRADLTQTAKAPHARIVGLCDVDANHLGKAVEMFPQAKAFRDWRKLLDELGDDVDAVVVSTPDHMHGPIAIAAMRLGKHVYCQKPIAHNLHECRLMADLATEKKLVTQMGTQIHAHEAYRTAVATLATGVIGTVSEAHLWVSKSWAGPKAGRPEATDPTPESLDWDLWLGVAPDRPYAKGAYHPARWRGWLDFGAGTLGDMGCHIFDPVFSALELGAPTSCVSNGPQHHAETFAGDGDVVYEFPGSERTTETLRMRWTDGSGSRPAADKAQLPDGVELPRAGSFLVGEKGVMVIPHWSMPRFFRDGEVIEVTLERRESGNHYHEWVAACRGEGETSTPFAYSGPLTEAVLLGTVAGHYRGTKLTWDRDARTLSGDDDAQRWVRRAYRDGWSV